MNHWRYSLVVSGVTACVVAAVLVQQQDRVANPAPAFHFENATAQTRITFQHSDGGSEEHYLYELMASGLALFDYDGDEQIDLYFLNGAPKSGRGRGNALYRNEGNWKFADVTDAAGLRCGAHSLGVAVGDYNNDGAADMYVSNFGPNVLYHNNGDGTFTDMTSLSGVACGNNFGAGVAFFDMDLDGDLDLYAAQYVDFDFERHAVLAPRSFPFPPSHRDFPPTPDVLLRNAGNGRFVDVSRDSGIGLSAAPSMGIVCFDSDGDGDTDVFVCNDGTPNFLFQNDGHGRFREAGVASGLAVNYRGEPTGSMGVDCADYDNDGRLDLFVTDYTGEFPVLYRNLGFGDFQDVTVATGAGTTVFPHTNWGVGLVDLDNDGDRDAFIANGHFVKNIDRIDNRTSYRVRDTLLENRKGKFADASASSGSGLSVVESSRGAGFDDLDNDGDLDIVTLNANARPTVLRNETDSNYHWLQFEIRGRNANRSGIGARIQLYIGDSVQVAEVHGGRGYQSHFGSRVHFGVGSHKRVDRVEVRWPGGSQQSFENLATDRRYLLVEGSVTALRHAPVSSH